MKSFAEAYRGYLTGILRWEQWDEIRHHVITTGESWYLYAVGHGVPEAPLAGESLATLLSELDALLRRDHDESYFGIAYTDDLAAPTLIKIYDPNNLGSSCGSSGRTIPPGWILSRMPPDAIASDLPLPNNRKRWWQSLLERVS